MIAFKSQWDRALEKLKANPKLEWAVYIALIVIVLALFFTTGNDKSSKTDTSAGSLTENQESLEEKLQQTLSSIDGAGEVKVLISYSTSNEIVPAMQTNKQSSGEQSSSEQSQPVTVRGNDQDGPMILMEKMPQIKGVIVVAKGAHDLTVKMNLLRATQTALDVDASMVEIFAMDSKRN